MRTVVCLFSLLCTVYALIPVDPIKLPPRPSYKGCNYEGKFYPVGEFKPNDCMFCNCLVDGQASCAILDCARPQCPNPVKVAGQCCPVCRGYYGGGGGPQEYRPIDSNVAIP